MPTFTASIEAEDADEWRSEREMTDDDIRAEYVNPISDDFVRRERLLATANHGSREEEVMQEALRRVVRQASDASATTVVRSSDSSSDRPLRVNPLSLDGAVITIKVDDFVATATLVLPDQPTED